MPPTATHTGPGDASTVWTRPSRGSRGPAPGFSRSEIAAAGIALADRRGLDAVSMRAVALLVGTSAGSLYRYVASRDELVDLMVDSVLSHDIATTDGERWDDRVVALAMAQLALHRQHPWMADAVATRRAFGPGGLDWLDSFLAALVAIERPSTVKMELIALVIGVVTLFSRREQASGSRSIGPAQMFSAIDPDRHRHLVAALSDPSPRDAPDDLFERTIRALAHGLLAPEDGADESPDTATPA